MCVHVWSLSVASCGRCAMAAQYDRIIIMHRYEASCVYGCTCVSVACSLITPCVICMQMFESLCVCITHIDTYINGVCHMLECNLLNIGGQVPSTDVVVVLLCEGLCAVKRTSTSSNRMCETYSTNRVMQKGQALIAIGFAMCALFVYN